MKLARLTSLFALACAFALAIVGAVALHNPALAEPVQQSNTRVSLTADAGFNSYVKENVWMPVRVTLVNSGDPIDGEVVMTNLRQGITEGFSQFVSLGRNARRQVTLYFLSNSDSYEVRLLSAGRVIATVTPVVRQLANSDRLVLVASDPPDAFNFIGDVRSPNGSTTALAPLRLEQIPDRTFALDTVDVIVLDNVDTSSLTQAQRAAIRAWVIGGGHLILSGGPNAGLVLGGFDEFAPARAGQALINASVENLDQLTMPLALAEARPTLTQTVPIMALQPNSSNARALVNSADTPLILRREIGRGLVDQLAFDPSIAPMRDWSGRALLFAALLGGRVNLPNGIGQLQNVYDPIQAAGAVTAASPPPTLVVGGFFALYVLVIGPINFFFLRKMKRQTWAWITIPSIVIAFTLLGLLTGFRLRGNNPHVHRLSVSLGDAQTTDARVFGLFGLYSPRRINVDFVMGRSLVENVVDPGDTNPAASTAIVNIGDPGRVRNLALSNTEVRTAYTRGEGQLPRIDATLSFVPPANDKDAPMIAGSIRNLSSNDYQNCVLLAGKDYHALGDLPNGKEINASVGFLLNHPQSAMNLRGINATRDRYSGGRYASYGSSGRSSKPSSASANLPSSSKFPFDQIGAPTVDALVNWQDFKRDTLTQDAMYGLVSTVFGPDMVGNGVYLGCWEQRDMTGAQVTGAEYTDRGLRLWRLPVKSALIDSGQTLPPDVFTWNILASSSSSEFNDSGLSLEPGQHIIGLTPWFDMRTTNPTSTVSLNLNVDVANSSLSGLRDTSVWLYNWQTKQYDKVVERLDEIAESNEHTGPYLSPSGELRIKIDSPTEPMTLNFIGASVAIP